MVKETKKLRKENERLVGRNRELQASRLWNFLIAVFVMAIGTAEMVVRFWGPVCNREVC